MVVKLMRQKPVCSVYPRGSRLQRLKSVSQNEIQARAELAELANWFGSERRPGALVRKFCARQTGVRNNCAKGGRARLHFVGVFPLAHSLPSTEQVAVCLNILFRGNG